MDDFLEEQEDNPINHEHEKPKSHKDEWETEDFQEGFHEDIEEAEDDTTSDIQLPSTRGEYPCPSHCVIGEEVWNSIEDKCIEGNRKQNLHNYWNYEL